MSRTMKPPQALPNLRVSSMGRGIKKVELIMADPPICKINWRDLAKFCIAKFGGERGIRTLGTTVSSTRDFQSRSFSQLGHLSAIRKE